MVRHAAEGGKRKKSLRCAANHALLAHLLEWESPDFEETSEYKAALDTPWRTKVIDGGIVRRERRVMHLHRAFDPDTAIKTQAQEQGLVGSAA